MKSLSHFWTSWRPFALAACALFSSVAKVDSADPPKSPSSNAWVAEQGLVVHEWGTFTSFSGSDGAFLEFRPLRDEVSDLPGFVWNRFGSDQASILAKTRIRGRVRMETPVLYFYTDQIQEMKVKVDFPKGLLTEFYPPVQEMLPQVNVNAALGEGELIGNSSLDWGNVTLIPTHSLLPEIADQNKRAQLIKHLEKTAYPVDARNLHYGEARATRSAMVHVGPQQHSSPTWKGSSDSHTEKFLFYRGVGSFDQPLAVAFDPNSAVSVSNRCKYPIASAMMLKVEGESLWMSPVQTIAPGQAWTNLEMKRTDLATLGSVVADTLVAQGLYRDEATAMVRTWQSSWFAEEGTRVLYLVPQEITDQLLPLHLDPVPKTLVRVLVGRLDLLSPKEEQSAIQAMLASASIRQAKIEAGEKAIHMPIPESIAKYGRMAEPILTRVSQIARDQTVRTEAASLISENFGGGQ